MMWDYWLTLFLETHSTARGLSSSSIAAYRKTLEGFRGFVLIRLGQKNPDQITPVDVLKYLDYLRKERDNGSSAVNRQVVVIKNFYRALTAMGHLAPEANPMAFFPKIKAAPRKLPTWLSKEEMETLLRMPRTDTVLGLRDRALIVLLYATGIRASECSNLREKDIDWGNRTIQVTGKGRHQRVIPLNADVIDALNAYKRSRDAVALDGGFFQSRKGNPMSRNAIYERVRTLGKKAGLEKPISPHRLRHTFATHLVKEGVDLLTISKLLGHRQLTSTQIYLHITAEDLREAADKHPVGRLVEKLVDFMPNQGLPFQYPRAERARKEA